MSNESQFDPNLFLDATTSEVNVKLPPLPTENPAAADGLYVAQIGEVKMESGTIEKGERAGQPWLSAIIPLIVEVPQQLQEALKYPPTYQVTDRVFIDLTPQKTIDNAPGRNRGQRAYRDALDLNKPGDSWSWRKATSSVVKVKISHEMYNNEPQVRVGAVLKR